MKTAVLGLTAVLAFGFLTGCVPDIRFAPANLAQTYPVRTRPENIELFRAAAPQKKYSEVGGLSYCCGSNVDSIIGLFRQKASESGGDALIGLDFDATGAASASVIRYQ